MEGDKKVPFTMAGGPFLCHVKNLCMREGRGQHLKAVMEGMREESALGCAQQAPFTVVHKGQGKVDLWKDMRSLKEFPEWLEDGLDSSWHGHCSWEQWLVKNYSSKNTIPAP